MIIAGVLTILFLIFFFLKRHIGPALLAMIAGLSVYETFGDKIVNLIQNIKGDIPADLIKVLVFLVLILLLPMLLYFQSGRGGLFGILRFVEALIFSALLTSLCAWCINYFVPFDDLSRQILTEIDDFKGIIIAIGTAIAYFDILLYHTEY